MHAQVPNRVRNPHGLAFPVHELVFVHAWAEARGLTMRVLLDQMLEGAPVEEMLLVRVRAAPRRRLMLWRAGGSGVVAQVEGGVPLLFGGIHAALSQLGASFAAKPARVPAVWRRLLGWRRG